MKYLFSLFLAGIISLGSTAFAQDCKPPAVVFNSNSGNIFSFEQEMILGELIMQKSFADMRYVKDEALLAYVRAIGDRLVAHLPPTGLKFQFHIVDYPEANAFNIPGGHVFLTRKMVGFARSEDEIAGVVAHELGHAYFRHGAISTSAMFNSLLNVTSVGDRRDITEKFNRFIESTRTKKVSQKSNHEDDTQQEADRLGLYAMVAAGYDSESRFSYFDRLTESEGKTGSWFSDLFKKTTPNQKRLREMAKTVDQLPAACREGRKPVASDVFFKWQADVVSFRPSDRTEALPGLISRKELSPKLRSDVSRLLVSPAGRYIVARDDFSLTVLEREPLKMAFQIPVESVYQYYVTADEKYVVLLTYNLRFEKWDIAEQKAVEVREFVIKGNCFESRLSPDGNYLACLDTSLAANIIHVPTGERVFQKKDFYRLTWSEYVSWTYAPEDETRRPFFRIEFTPDSSIAIFSRSNHFRVDPTALSVASRMATHDTNLAVDVGTRRPVDIGGVLSSVFARSYVFLDRGRILGMETGSANDGGIFSFPDGKRLSKFVFYTNEIERTGNPDYLIIKPLRNSPMGVFDVKAGQIALGMGNEDAAIWKNQIIFESSSGKIVVRELLGSGRATSIDGPDVGSLDLPSSSIGGLSSAAVSNNLEWLLLSSTTRGGLWNLPTGELRLHVTGFRGGLVADDGGAVAEFPKHLEESHSLVLFNPGTKSVGVIRELPGAAAKQFGRFVLIRTSLEQKSVAKEDDKKDPKKEETKWYSGRGVFDDIGDNLMQNVRWELKDFIQDKVIWSSDFPKQAPRYAFDEFSGRMLLYWNLTWETTKAKVDANPALKAKAAALGNKEGDYLIEVIDAFAGKHLGQVFLETGKRSFNVGGGMSEGDWMVVYDSQDRVLVYSISTGELKHRFFGGHAALSPLKNLLAVENFPGEVTLYDLATGEPRSKAVVRGRAALVRFNVEGTRLFVLTSLQTAYVFDVNAMGRQPVP